MKTGESLSLDFTVGTLIFRTEIAHGMECLTKKERIKAMMSCLFPSKHRKQGPFSSFSEGLGWESFTPETLKNHPEFTNPPHFHPKKNAALRVSRAMFPRAETLPRVRSFSRVFAKRARPWCNIPTPWAGPPLQRRSLRPTHWSPSRRLRGKKTWVARVNGPNQVQMMNYLQR